MYIKGGKGLSDLIRYVEHVRDEAVPDRREADEIAKDILRLIHTGFETSTDPYGKPWAPIKPRKDKKMPDGSIYPAKNYNGRDDQPLVDSANLMSSIDYGIVTTASGGFKIDIATDVDYAVYHQEGDGVQQRMFMPDSSKELPQSYYNVIIDIIGEKLARAIR